MKKTVLILLLLGGLLVARPLAAQINFGIKAGVGLTELKLSGPLSDNLSAKNRVGFFAGPMAEFIIPVVGLGVDASLLYTERNADLQGIRISERGLDVPVNLKFVFGLGRTLGLYLSAGPAFFFDFEKNKRVFPIQEMSWEKRQIEVAANLGLGVRLLRHFQLGISYNMPLKNSAQVITNGVEQAAYKAKTWQLSAAYIF